MPFPQGADLAQVLVDQARADGVELVEPEGLLSGLAKQVLETALAVEMDEHLGYEHGDRDAKTGTNERDGTRAKTVHTEIGPVGVEVSRDRDGSFVPVIVKKRQCRLTGIDEMVLALTARGLTSGEISAHLAEVCGTEVFKEAISRVTDQVIDEMVAW
jgi:transposase-like protein